MIYSFCCRFNDACKYEESRFCEGIGSYCLVENKKVFCWLEFI